MPIESEIDHEHEVIVSTARGDIGLEDMRLYFARSWAEPASRGYSELFDLGQADRVALSVGELRSLAGAAHAMSDAGAGSRLAIVVPPGEARRMAESYRTLRELRGKPGDYQGPEIRVFTDLASARVWLGLPTDDPASR